MPTLTEKKQELLAPAGSLESFFAALESGADAIFCGLKEFSARAKAINFTLEEMERLSAYAHKEGRSLYVTLNTLIKENELQRVVEVLAALASCRVDGIIIQDLGVWRLARKHFPELPLHASTQMTIHNAAGVKKLEEMGFSRAVLARELSLEEIQAIRRQTKIELEHFIHGALCYSISGKCFFSSYLAGKSGNRGRCVQPCRRQYREKGKKGFYFSTSDFSSIELFPELIQAGIMSFKIEGRMKNAEYVSTVVKAYRMVLDARPSERHLAVREAANILKHSYGRKTTRGFLQGPPPDDIVLPFQKGGIGQQLGRVEKIEKNALFFQNDTVVHVGDRLRVQPRKDLPGISFTVKELGIGKSQVKRAPAGSFVRIPTPFNKNLGKGDLIYKLSTGKSFTLSEEACRRRLAAVSSPAEEIDLMVVCRDSFLQLEARVAGSIFTEKYAVEMQTALHTPLTKETLQKIFQQTAHKSLTLSSLTAGPLPPVAIKPSKLKEIRRDFYNILAESVSALQKENLTRRIKKAGKSLLHASPPRAVHKAELTASTSIAPKQNWLTQYETIKRLLLPLSEEIVQKAKAEKRRDELHGKQIIWDIPALVFESQWPAIFLLIDELIDLGFSCFRLNNLAHFSLFNDRKKISLIGGPWLYALNSQAALALEELGAKEFSLSLEDDRENMAAILKKDITIAASATILSPINLVTSRIPMQDRQSGTVFATDRGKHLWMDFSSGLTVGTAGNTFSLTGHLQELLSMGCGKFFIDLDWLQFSKDKRQEIMAAVEEDCALPGTSLFNFERGLE
ncbi:MAG: U32 family peptidase [Desulfobulbaceae bacterium]|nr:U32 family peptidase [Desulfobulbaceae bacterium]